MSTLTRNDGTQFVIQAYRELLQEGTKSVLTQQVKSLAEQHGQFVRLFKKEDGQYEAVFSAQAGYLLGESVKNYFYQSDHLIFCETIADSTQLLIVVVRNGNVFLDTLVEADNLHHELLPLMTGENPYQVFTCGEVPLVKNCGEDNTQHFSLPSELVSTFETLDRPLLPRLPTMSTLQLQPLPLALKAQHLTQQKKIYLVWPIATVAALLLWTVNLVFHHKTPPIQVTPSVRVNPYHLYYEALNTPAPQQLLAELYNTINALMQIPGWQIQHIRLSNKTFIAKTRPNGGNIHALQQWANQYHYQYQITPQAILLMKLSTTIQRKMPSVILPANQTLAELIDRIDYVTHNKLITIQQTEQHQQIREIKLVVTLQDSSMDALTVIGEALHSLPIAISAAQFDVSMGSINGTLSLSIWGT